MMTLMDVTMSNAKANSPASGYKTESLLKSVVSGQTTSLVKRDAVQFASNKLNSVVNQKLGKAGLTGGLSDSAINQAVQGARSVSDKLNGALGGKLGSVLGSGIGGAGAEINKTITNLKSGAVSKVSSMVQNKLGSALSGALGKSIGGMLGGTIGKLSDSGAKSLAGAKIVAGFLDTGPKDDLLVTDVYGVSDGGILNALGDKIGGFAQDAFGSLRKSPNLLSDLTSMIASGGQNWAISKENLISRVVGTLGGRSGIIDNLAGGLRDTIINGTGLPPSIYDTAVAMIGGQGTRFNAGNIESARDVFGLINQITNGARMEGFTDIGSESSLMAGIMREAIALGVPDAIDVLVENARNDEVAYNALYANMVVAVEHSDLDSIQIMINKIGVNAFLAQVPNAVPLLLSSYELPIGTMDEEYETELLALEAVLGALRPNWYQVKRGAVFVNDLTAYADLSADARKLLLRREEHQVAAIIGSTYSGRPDMVDELQRMYPLAPIKEAA